MEYFEKSQLPVEWFVYLKFNFINIFRETLIIKHLVFALVCFVNIHSKKNTYCLRL